MKIYLFWYFILIILYLYEWKYVMNGMEILRKKDINLK